ncbi:MAG TPA: S-methyl-5-thioribose-1-phosphate isomerase [Spirochaetia bacterium]|nr:S-methyl-5-thioribose-1-phosphate isomerase [Spirochaetales bacterium]HRW23446.1 S-methyl-5-thioribose-1-phosphate isomerase [Spirochaetia bacterium]
MNPIIAMEYSDDRLRLVDQRRLPGAYETFECRTWRDCVFAIKDMVVRGAPAIGAAAAYGAALAALEYSALGAPEFGPAMRAALGELRRARPTAVNLMWAVDRMAAALDASLGLGPGRAAYERLKAEADAVLADETDRSERIAEYGAALVPDGAVILTHCNTGSLAVPGPGTALGIIKAAHRAGKGVSVYADETRPRLQGARLTAWELDREGVPVTLIADSVAATLMRDGKISLVVVGADRIAANGDAANKIGTFMLSALAERYGVPFYVAAPVSTIDFGCPSGDAIAIEERSPDEVTTIEGVRVAPAGVRVYNPAFDVTPAGNITAIVTERGVLRPPYGPAIAALRPGAGEGTP